MQQTRIRCPWPGTDSLYIKYHDEEWGVPCHNDQKLFEYLVLDGQQAGLSWLTVLRKRENYRLAMKNFNPEKVAKFSAGYVEKLLQNPGLIRNKLKINGAVKNAQAFLKVQKEFGSFDAYIWSFVGSKTIKNRFTQLSQLPAKTKEAEAMSLDLKKRGFTFVGPTICYAFMQAAGLVNDHIVSCFRYSEV